MTMDPCAFDKLFTKSVPHILEKIFFSLDFKSFNTCMDVSKTWRDLLTSDSYLAKGRLVFHNVLFLAGLFLQQDKKLCEVIKLVEYMEGVKKRREISHRKHASKREGCEQDFSFLSKLLSGEDNKIQ